MKKFEVLSPAGDMESFNIAIDSGADAVYFGLNKFNARMKADNISLDKLQSVVEYAHLRDVRVYVTINTLISDAEISELIDVVGFCLECGVDAFIVQDYGVIGVLKQIYPNIVLHGSTQLGVHNRRGASVAKEMGLSRVVLARETTLEDIVDIKNNVDIELEVFVQGAMCVCFSGNCYMSSLKHNASGNRGLCKQLCRLPYEITANGIKSKGYFLSPRDNCMVDYLSKLCDIGVVSFKIEGRLRRGGYVATATRVYREIIDSIYLNKKFDATMYKNDLKKVFSRGEFVSGYFDGNDVIDPVHNNHVGEKIGKVLKCEKFKDIYRISLDVNVDLHSGDGLKIFSQNKEVSLGVGNIDKVGNIQIIYSKNKVELNDTVFRVLDFDFENNIKKNVRRRKVSIFVELEVNKPIKVSAVSDCFAVSAFGANVQPAQSKPLTFESVKAQMSKLGDDAFEIDDIQVSIKVDVFLPVSELNAIRRDVINKLKTEILNSYKLPFVKNDISAFDNNLELSYRKIAIVNETCNIAGLNHDYDALALSPKLYDLKVIKQFYEKYKKIFNTNMIINMPICVLKNDLDIIDEIVKYSIENNIILLANNIYTLDYIKKGAIVWAGSNMNVVSNYSHNALVSKGVKEVVSSTEKWFGSVPNTYKMCNGNRVLMTMAHCPFKTITKQGCESVGKLKCSYTGNIKLKGQCDEFLIRRYKIKNCYFELVDSYYDHKTSKNAIDDLREVE